MSNLQMTDPQHPEKGPWIAELREGQRFMGFYLMRSPSLETFKDPTRGKYVRLLLADRSGTMEARLWEKAEQHISEIEDQPIHKIEAEVESFRDQLQVRILRLRPAKEEEYELADLRPTTQRSIEEMDAAVEHAINSITDTHLKAIVKYFYDQETFRTAFKEAPAATRVHHAFIGGLLEHTYEVLRLAEELFKLYPQINRDLLVAGILLHDIGKLSEFKWDIDIEYTSRGKLLGHVVIGSEMVAQAIQTLPNFPEDLALQLQHMILAHHGRYEYGSPRRPKTLEAIALHQLENLDAQVNRFVTLIQEAKKLDRSWTTYDHLLGRSLYTGSDEDISIEELGWTD
jgi:3'-5' exoribonuclease